jgi:hypothetical protein
MTGSLGIVAESTIVTFATLAIGPEFAGNESNLVLLRIVSSVHQSMVAVYLRAYR